MRVDARDVLDANARTTRTFRARVIGHFRRTGPNSWDDYEYVPREGGEELEVSPTLDVQIEPHGVELRLRRGGRVVRVRWIPDSDDEDALDGASAEEVRAYFLAHHLGDFAEAKGIGAAAVIASKLS